MELQEQDVNVLLNHFYSAYFVDYLEEVIADDACELSVVTLFRGMDFFFRLCEKYKIDFLYSSKEDYLIKNYENGQGIYMDLRKRYDEEIVQYHDKEIDFCEAYGKLKF